MRTQTTKVQLIRFGSALPVDPFRESPTPCVTSVISPIDQWTKIFDPHRSKHGPPPPWRRDPIAQIHDADAPELT
jgi:hypothetical protein